MIMQTDISRMRIESNTSSATAVAGHQHHHLSFVHNNGGSSGGGGGISCGSTSNHARAINLFQTSRNMTMSHHKRMSCDDDDDLNRIESASETDENAIEMKNSCRRLMEKPPLVKRLTMGLLRAAEDRSPLVHTSSLTTHGTVPYSQDGYVNEGVICDPERIIATTFGDSCRDTLNQFNSHINSNSSNNNNNNSDGNDSGKPCMLQNGDRTQQQFQQQAGNRGEGNNEFEYKRNIFHETHNNVNIHHFPVVPIRNDSLSLYEQNELKGASWFQAGIPREISLEVLSRQPPGAFLVRQSTTKIGCFALSLRVPPPAPKVAHYLILRTIRGYKIKGFTKEFSTLTALITHHSVMPELLPVPLSLPRNYMNVSSKQSGDFEYGDIRNVMQSSGNSK